MKKIAALFAALVLTVGLCACTAAAATWQEQYDLGVRYLSEGNYREAIIAFNAAIEIDPRRADAYIGLADAYEAQGDVERARQVLENALAVVADADAIRSRLDGLEGNAAPEITPESTPEPTPESTPEPTPEPAPVYLLMWQAAYRVNGTMWMECLRQYDAQGYLILREEKWDSKSNIETYEYSEYMGGQAIGWIIPDRRDFASEEDWLAARVKIATDPGNPGGYSNHIGSWEDFSIHIDPLFTEDERAAVLANGGVLANETGDNGWAYAVYTFDEAGNPVSCVTYNDADVITGTAAFEWQLLDIS